MCIYVYICVYANMYMYIHISNIDDLLRLSTVSLRFPENVFQEKLPLIPFFMIKTHLATKNRNSPKWPQENLP